MSCGEGHQFRTRDVAQQAENGGSQCVGKKYSIGGKVRPDMTDSSLLLTDLQPLLVLPGLLSHGLPVVGLELVSLLQLLWWRSEESHQVSSLSSPVRGPAL